MTPWLRVTNAEASAAGGDGLSDRLRGSDLRPGPGGQDRATARSSCRSRPRSRPRRSASTTGSEAGPCVVRTALRDRAGWPGEQQPDAHRDEDCCWLANCSNTCRAGEQFDADHRSGDDTGQGPADEQQGQPSPGLSLPPVAVQRPRRRHHVVKQVGGSHRRARRAEHADPNHMGENASGDTSWSHATTKRLPRTPPPGPRPRSSQGQARGHGNPATTRKTADDQQYCTAQLSVSGAITAELVGLR